ncbi:hypothetical protein VSU19_13310 [Verrucomicrobiales bacterium BCK34]|nr:hypothetical protein [Verrucomicrobiales bacterium BCK34]
MKLEQITAWRDATFREAALEMALDHALLDHAIIEGEAFARFYTWNTPSVTVGYFHEMEPAAHEAPAPVRRYTGGGTVEHGEDITFALIFPPGSSAANASSATRYHWIHSELARALNASGYQTALHSEPFKNSRRPCFQHAVSEDLVDPDTGKKICGGAQRRCKGAVIHQGSIRLPAGMRALEASWIDHFLNGLSATQNPLDEKRKNELITRAIEIERERYGTAGWNERREAKMKIKF